LTGRAAPLPEFGIFCCEARVFDNTRDAVSANNGPLSTTVGPKIREERQITGQPSAATCLQPVYPAWEKPND
jgi:hypothetical protein